MICSWCGKDIAAEDRVAEGPSGTVHYQCFKHGTAHGEEITLFSLYEHLGALKKRVQDLERIVEGHDRSIDFRIG